MRIARIQIAGTERLANVIDGVAHPIAVRPESELAVLLSDRRSLPHAAGGPMNLDRIRLLSPIGEPRSVIAVGLNYADHAAESGLDIPTAPITFAKLPQSVVGPGATIAWTQEQSTEVDYEAELAVIIGREARDVTVDSALDHIIGYTCCNDVSARNAQFADGQWLRAKSFDTFCPLGPWIATPDEIPDPQNLSIACRVNGSTLQDSNTNQMIFSVAEIISYLSRYFTLRPGDVITTGTPVGVGFARTPPVYLQHGDIVEVDIEGIGVLRNLCGPR